jgi:hypothetical protein
MKRLIVLLMLFAAMTSHAQSQTGIAGAWRAVVDEITDSTFEQPLPAARRAQAARAHDRNGARMKDSFHVYPEQAAAGLWTTPTDLARFAIELQLAVPGRSSRVLTPAWHAR